jgi:hypothetical protein
LRQAENPKPSDNFQAWGMIDINQVRAWKNVAAELDIRVVAPCDIPLPDGTHLIATAHIQDFGGANGLIADPDWAVLEPYADVLVASGYGFSAVSLDSVNDQWIIEMLADWTWCGKGPAPAWLSDVSSDQRPPEAD